MRPTVKVCHRGPKLLHSYVVQAIALACLVPSCLVGRTDAQIASVVPDQSVSQATVQSAAQTAVAPVDSSVLRPEPTAKLGQMDATAVAEVAAFNATLGGGKRWVGMQGTGIITYGKDPTQYSVTLTKLGMQRFRLDMQTPGGPQSIRIQGRLGKLQAGDKPALSMSPDTATLGIFPFEITGRAEPDTKNASVLDRGISMSNGRTLHRVTLELPSMGWDTKTHSQGLLPIDLYFDPTTHLLIKSACYIYIPGGKQVPFLSVTTYGDYRRIGASMVPFSYSETLEGQPYRTVQLTSIQLKPTLSADYFQFQEVR